MRARTFAVLLMAVTVAAFTKGSNAPGVPSTTTSKGEVSIAAASDAVPVGAIRFTVEAAGNAARYRVREQLMGKDFPNDAIGETSQITGGITVDSTTGTVVAAQSKFTVGTGTLKSDSDRRDGYVKNRILETEKFPTVELAPIALKGLTAAAVGGKGPVTFEVIGELTLKGVKHSTTWRVTASQAAGKVTGSAATKFTFADFGITPPKVPILLSVADTIALEYDFTLTRDGVIR